MNEFYRLEKMIAEIQTKVELYQELFGSEESVKALNHSFPECFSNIQESLFFEIVCRTSALFDPAATRSDNNLTLDYLVTLSGGSYSKDLHLTLESIKLDFKTTGLKKIRNKLYAHNDLKSYMGKRTFVNEISYEGMLTLLSRCFSFVRTLGVEADKIDKDQIIVRSTTLPSSRNGKILVSRLINT
ncbi:MULTISPECIES: AbiU2 domain-containing protein [unclassified Vibrio]|nr:MULTISPECIES: hypothetical protein [unclassified Vibrio]QFT36145.1 hypothetical protein FIU99_06855 [Vibrio sp. THAF64]QGM34045.1 hypothetical protein GGC04_06865 [Vibrio sp. THAF191d]QGN69547.1 hypothetical protein GGC03_06870 [Vibrio sp. THAF191c]